MNTVLADYFSEPLAGDPTCLSVQVFFQLGTWLLFASVLLSSVAGIAIIRAARSLARIV